MKNDLMPNAKSTQSVIAELRKCILLTIILLFSQTLIATTIISVGPGQQYQDIQTAVDYASTVMDDIVINIASGVYDPVAIEEFDSYSLTLNGLDPRATFIDGNNQHTPIKIGNCHAPITINGLDLINGNGINNTICQEYASATWNGAGHYDYWTWTLDLTNIGGGLYGWHAGSITMSDCKFSSNTAYRGRGLFLCDAHTIIQNCIFTDNNGNGLNEVYTCMTNLEISETTFSGNTNVQDVVYLEQLHALEEYDFMIEECLFANNNPTQSALCVDAYPTATMEMKNCTLAYNHMQQGPALYIQGSIGLGPQLFHVFLENNIIWYNDSILLMEFSSGDTVDPNLHQVLVGAGDKVKIVCRNNDYHDITELESGINSYMGFVPEFYDNIDSDPLFCNPALQDFSLFWTESVKSPCINTGYPGEENELTDPDGTPPDIGCFYYPHYHGEYFERYNPSGIYWLSFPVVDDRTYSAGQYWNELGFLFEDNMGVPPDSPLDQIQWSYNGDSDNMYYSGIQWQNSFERVFQPIGYKALFNPSLQNDPVIVNGFKASACQTPVLWQVESGSQLFENWIGYFVPYTQTVSDAFSELVPGSERTTYLDHVYSIKTQTWGTCRTDYQYGSPWLDDPKRYTLSEEDMAVVVLLPDAPEEMYWNTFSTPTESVIREPPTAFSYEEKLDYTPVFVEFDPDDLPAEVGLYVDGQCLGAAVVDSTLVEVNLYPEQAKESGELCLMFYYEGKGKQGAPGWRLYDPASLVFSVQPLRISELGDYAYLSYRHKEGDSLLPLATSLKQNYPNPFNPNTTISFILAGGMDASLEIFNLRGQKVRTLHNGKLAKGKHYLVWNGRDDQNSPVSSGIYFSRLTTPNGSFVNKMMLMK